MAWLTSLLKKPEEIAEAEPALLNDPGLLAEQETEVELPPAPSGPQLAVLAPDVAGISSFRLSMYADAGTASREIERMHPEMRRSTHAFWALHEEPVLPDDAHREALVLIRANHTSNVVYVVSFVDLESAWSFARFEAKRGLDVSHLIILWAAFATVREEFDGVSILPPTPPRTFGAVETIERPQTLEDEPVREPAPETERLVPPPLPRPQRERETVRDTVEAPTPERTSEAEDGAARRAEEARVQAEEAAHIARQAQEELQAARAAADAQRIAEMQQAEAEERERAAAEEERRIAAEAQAALEARVEVELQPMPEPTVLDTTTTTAPQPEIEIRPPATETPSPQPVRSYPGDEESYTDDDGEQKGEPQARGTVFMHDTPAVEVDPAEQAAEERRQRILAAADDPTAEFPKSPDLDEFDIAYEVERLLKNRRFDKREEPFKGFESPPGRF